MFETCLVADARAAESRELCMELYRLIENCMVIHCSRCAAGTATTEEHKAIAFGLV